MSGIRLLNGLDAVVCDGMVGLLWLCGSNIGLLLLLL